MTPLPIADVQSSADSRRIAIDKVGIKDIRHPIRVRDRSDGEQHTVATFNMYVYLPHNFKGTHMSRFVQILNKHEKEIGVESFKEMLTEMAERLESEKGHIEMRFPYFVNKRAPVSGVESLLDYDVTFIGEILKGVWIEEIIDLVEKEASCELYGLLKRPDEKYVTERAYDNPKFVEDMVRDVAIRLNADDRIGAYRVESENFESIHNHSAYALIERDKEVEEGR